MTTSLDDLRRLRTGLEHAPESGPWPSVPAVLLLLLDDLISRRESYERLDYVVATRAARAASTPPGTVAISRDALAALCALYELAHNDIETYGAEHSPGYVLLTVADDRRLNEACEACVPHMPALRTILGAETP